MYEATDKPKKIDLLYATRVTDFGSTRVVVIINMGDSIAKISLSEDEAREVFESLHSLVSVG